MLWQQSLSNLTFFRLSQIALLAVVNRRLCVNGRRFALVITAAVRADRQALPVQQTIKVNNNAVTYVVLPVLKRVFGDKGVVGLILMTIV